MKVTTKGQVTIPLHIRRFLGIAAHSEVDFAIEDDLVVLKASDESHEVRDESRFRLLRGIKKGDLSTDEWLAATRGE